MAGKYYAVKNGKVPGIYTSWDKCRAMVHGFPGAIYKSFQTIEEAQAFLGEGAKTVPVVIGAAAAAGNMPTGERVSVDAEEEKPAAYAFVDGSYNAATKVYGYGGFLRYNGKKEVLQGAGDEADMASMRNVAGEVLGSMAAIAKAVELGLPKLTIYYDYMGIEMWATGRWKRNKKGTIAYYEYVNSVSDKIQLEFVKVKGHSGVEGNEEADALAKEAVGNIES